MANWFPQPGERVRYCGLPATFVGTEADWVGGREQDFAVVKLDSGIIHSWRLPDLGERMTPFEQTKESA